MFQKLWEIIAIPLGYIMRWCYILVNDVMNLPVSYLFAIFLFTLITKALMFPLSLKQQKSSASQAAFQPMLNEINTKYAKDPQKKQEELAKFQREYGYSPMAGCLPLLINFPIIFGLIEVIYKPLSYMLRIPKDVLKILADKAVEIGEKVAANSRYIETNIIELVKTKTSEFMSIDISSLNITSAEFTEYIDKIKNLDMTIGKVNLWEKPELALSWALVIPIFSIATILLSSYVTMKATGGTADKTQRKSGYVMMGFSTLMFGFMSFTLPAAFSLYWGFSNLITVFQSLLLKRFVNAEKIKKEIEERIKAKRQEAKASKKVKIIDKDGSEVVKEMSPDELARYRLQKAREIDAEKYDS